jgi:hypothetical protein
MAGITQVAVVETASGAALVWAEEGGLLGKHGSVAEAVEWCEPDHHPCWDLVVIYQGYGALDRIGCFVPLDAVKAAMGDRDDV